MSAEDALQGPLQFAERGRGHTAVMTAYAGVGTELMSEISLLVPYMFW
jgi:hypothetical protein